MLNVRLFEGYQYPLEVFNRQSIIDFSIYFYAVDCDDVETGFDFPDYISSYFRVYNERSGRLIKNIPLVRSTSYLLMDISISDMTFEDEGNYYYEIGYIMSGGYDIVLRFGKLIVI